MKKIIALFLLAALLLNCCVLPAFAEEEADASEPVILIEDDMIANKGSTKSYLSSGTTWIEQDSMLELGEDAYLVYKVTAPATQGINFRVDFKNLNDDENGGIHQYSTLSKLACYVTSKEPAEDFAGDVSEWNVVVPTEKLAEDTYSYTYAVDSASGYEEEETIYVCFKFAANHPSHEGEQNWNNAAWIEKITATTVPYTGILVYDGTDHSAWETGTEDTETLAEGSEDKAAICYDFSKPAGGVDAEEIMAVYNPDMQGKSYDVSDMDFIVFDIYVTDKLLVARTEFCLELGSAGMPDEQEHEYIGCFGGLGDGWNTVVVRLGSFQSKNMDLTCFNYFRLYNTSPATTDKEFVLKIDNIRFEKAAKLESDYDGPLEEHLFFVLDDDTESEYMISNTAQASGTAFWFCDTTAEVVYKFSVTNRYSANKVLFTAMLSQQLLLQVSQDGESWENVYEYEYDPAGVPHQGLERQVMEFDLTSYLDLLSNPDVYIRIADANPSNGWGGTIHSDVPTTLAVQYTELSPEQWDEHESATDERSMSLMTCSKPFGSFINDLAVKTAGYSSLMLTMQENSINDMTFATPIDATGYDALEFDLFVANPALLKAEFADTGIELSSQGTCDDGEVSWTIADVVASHKIKEGWNHITLLFRDGKLDSKNAEFDPSAINYFRMYFVGTPEKYQGATLGIDNVRLTKAAAELDAEQARKDQEAADEVIEKIEAIGEVTTKSSSKIKRAQKAYDKLTDAQKALVTNYQALVDATAKYEELTNPPKEEDPEQNPGDNEQTPGGTEQKPGDTEQKPGDTQKPGDEGCASVMTLGAASMMLIAAAWVTLAARKKEN